MSNLSGLERRLKRVQEGLVGGRVIVVQVPTPISARDDSFGAKCHELLAQKTAVENLRPPTEHDTIVYLCASGQGRRAD